MNKHWGLLFLGIASLTGVGCNSSAVLFSTGTQFGIELETVGTNTQSVKVGYQRHEGVTMPTRVGRKGPLISEAYPVLSIFDYSSGSLLLGNLNGVKVKQVFATGKAAVVPNAVDSVGESMEQLNKEEKKEEEKAKKSGAMAKLKSLLP